MAHWSRSNSTASSVETSPENAVIQNDSVSVDSGGPVLMNALRAVEDAGVDVEDVALRQPKLDEVFLTLTGRPDADAALEAAAS